MSNSNHTENVEVCFMGGLERDGCGKVLKEEASREIGSHIRPFSPIFAELKKTDYGPTDGRTYPLIEMRGRI